MALNKLCRCGRTIPYNADSCENCSGYKREVYKQYNNRRTDKKEVAFYNSNEWKVVRVVVKDREYGLCKVCQAKEDISYVQTVHHIEELKECWDKRLDIENLIGLCESCHQDIHQEYKKKNKSKVKEWLRELAKT